jgi:hypothetical protein
VEYGAGAFGGAVLSKAFSWVVGRIATGIAAKAATTTVKKGAQAFDEAVQAAQKAYPKKAGRIEQHHITPQYLGGAKDGPLAPLDAAYHQQVTNEFRKQWGYGIGKPQDANDLRRIMDNVYGKYPLPPGYSY